MIGIITPECPDLLPLDLVRDWGVKSTLVAGLSAEDGDAFEDLSRFAGTRFVPQKPQ
jgi:hypothetical protein